MALGMWKVDTASWHRTGLWILHCGILSSQSWLVNNWRDQLNKLLTTLKVRLGGIAALVPQGRLTGRMGYGTPHEVSMSDPPRAEERFVSCPEQSGIVLEG